MKCPKCGTGDLAERKARRGNIFWGCTNYPKCDFTSNYKPVAKECPECGSPYLVEKTLRSGIYLECPNKKKIAEDESPKKAAKKSAAKGVGKKTAEPVETAVVCSLFKTDRAMRPPSANGGDALGRWWWRRRAEKESCSRRKGVGPEMERAVV